MDTEMKLPSLGENIETADVVRVLVQAGVRVAKDQPVLEVETEKATIDVPSPTDGVVVAVHVKPGDKIKVDQLVMTIGEGASVVPAAPAASVAPPETKPPADGISPTPVASARIPGVHPEPATSPDSDVHATPAVRKFAREVGVDLSDVTPSGPHGRASIEDVKRFVRERGDLLSPLAEIPPGVSVAAPVAESSSLPDFSRWGPVEREPMSKIRCVTAERMSNAWATVPHVTQFDRADITLVDRLRKEFEAKAGARGGKLSVTAVMVKVVVTALKAFPQFNSSVDMISGEIIRKKYFHIGVAVDTERGLLVPVIRDADRKNINDISTELASLAERARTKSLAPDDMQGGTFTISNLGGIGRSSDVPVHHGTPSIRSVGGTHFTPIVNWPEVAILGMSRAAMEPVWVDDRFEPRRMLPLSLSYDHRVIDGADGIRFLRKIVEALQQPFVLSLEG